MLDHYCLLYIQWCETNRNPKTVRITTKIYTYIYAFIASYKVLSVSVSRRLIIIYLYDRDWSSKRHKNRVIESSDLLALGLHCGHSLVTPARSVGSCLQIRVDVYIVAKYLCALASRVLSHQVLDRNVTSNAPVNTLKHCSWSGREFAYAICANARAPHGCRRICSSGIRCLKVSPTGHTLEKGNMRASLARHKRHGFAFDLKTYVMR